MPRGGAGGGSRQRSRRSTRPCARATRSRSASSSAQRDRDAGPHLGHITYWFHADKLAFVGDTLFSIGCGRVIEGTPEMMWALAAEAARSAGRHARSIAATNTPLANIHFAQHHRAGQCGAGRARGAGASSRSPKASRPSRPRSARRRRPIRSCAPTCRRSRPRIGMAGKPAGAGVRRNPRAGRISFSFSSP